MCEIANEAVEQFSCRRARTRVPVLHSTVVGGASYSVIINICLPAAPMAQAALTITTVQGKTTAVAMVKLALLVLC